MRDANKIVLFCSGTGKYDMAKDGFKLFTFTQITEYAKNPQNVSKDNGQWVMTHNCKSKGGRKKDFLLNPANAVYKSNMLWVDVDSGNLELEALKAFIFKRFGDIEYLLYTTKSCKQNERKWRILIPLAAPIKNAKYQYFATVLNDCFEKDTGVEPDAKTTTINQILYLPNKGDYYDHFHNPTEKQLEPSIFDNDVAALIADEQAKAKAEQARTQEAREANEKRTKLRLNDPTKSEAHKERERASLEGVILKILSDSVERVKQSADGQKHNILMREAKLMGGYDHAGFFTQNEVVQQMVDSIAGRCKSVKDAEKTANSAYVKGTKQPIDLAPLINNLPCNREFDQNITSETTRPPQPPIEAYAVDAEIAAQRALPPPVCDPTSSHTHTEKQPANSTPPVQLPPQAEMQPPMDMGSEPDMSYLDAMPDHMREMPPLVNLVHAPSAPAVNGSPVNDAQPIPLEVELPDGDAFPVQALGAVLEGGAIAIQDTTKAPMSMVCQSLLAAANLAVQGHGNISIGGVEKGISEFFLSIGESGERKSNVDGLALNPHYKVQKQMYSNYTDAVQNYRKDMAEYANLPKKEKLEKTEPDEPLNPSFITNDATFEGIFKQLKDCCDCIGVFSDEGGVFIGGHAMGKDNQVKTISGLSNLWDGNKPITKARKGDGVESLYGKRACMHLMAQPSVADLMLGSSINNEQGFLARFLMTYPKSTIGTRLVDIDKPPIDINLDTDYQDYCSHMTSLLDAPLPKQDSELSPRLISPTPEAQRQLNIFYNEIEAAQQKGGKYQNYKPFASKASEHVLRIAATLTLTGDIEASKIELPIMKNSITIMRFYLSEMVRLSGGATISNELKNAQKLLDWMQKKHSEGKWGVFDVRKIQQNCKPLKTAKINSNGIRELLKLLQDYNWVEPYGNEWHLLDKQT